MSTQTFIAPPKLKVNDTIGVISLSSVCDEKRLLAGKKILKKDFGLKVSFGEHILATHHNFAGTDEQRLADFQKMLDDPSIKAIITGRGGYGASRIIDNVCWNEFKKNPKWIIGFSDVTAVHQAVQSQGYQSIHGPMVVTLENDVESTQSLKSALFEAKLNYLIKGHKLNRAGSGKGAVIGGNLCLLAHSLGSEAELNYDNKVLFLEEIGEYNYNIDRMVLQLKRAGKLDNLAGLIVGQFTGCRETAIEFGKKAFEIIKSHVSEFDYPVSYNFPIGHEDKNLAIRCGESIKLEVKDKKVKLESLKN